MAQLGVIDFSDILIKALSYLTKEANAMYCGIETHNVHVEVA
jgi:hypothetical protein